MAALGLVGDAPANFWGRTPSGRGGHGPSVWAWQLLEVVAKPHLPIGPHNGSANRAQSDRGSSSPPSSRPPSDLISSPESPSGEAATAADAASARSHSAASQVGVPAWYRSTLPVDDIDDDSAPSPAGGPLPVGPSSAEAAGGIGHIAPWTFFCAPMDEAHVRRQLLATLAYLKQ